MKVEAQILINSNKLSVWQTITNIEEAAKIMNMPLRTLKRRWQTARNKLYETLK